MVFISDIIQRDVPSSLRKFKTFEVDPESIKQQGFYIKFSASLSYEVPETFLSSGLNGGNKVTHMVKKDIRCEGIANLDGRIMIPPIYARVNFPDLATGYVKVVYTIHQQNRDVDVVGYASRFARDNKFFEFILRLQ